MASQSPNVMAHRDLADVFAEVAHLYKRSGVSSLDWNGDTARVLLGGLLDILHALSPDLNAETYVPANAPRQVIEVPQGTTLEALAAEIARQLASGSFRAPDPNLAPPAATAVSAYGSAVPSPVEDSAEAAVWSAPAKDGTPRAG